MAQKKGNKTRLIKKADKKNRNAARRKSSRHFMDPLLLNTHANSIKEHLGLLDFSLSGHANLEKVATQLSEKRGQKVTPNEVREELEAYKEKLYLELGNE